MVGGWNIFAAMKKILLLAAGLLATGALFAQTPAFITDSLDSYVQKGIKEWQVPGLALVVVKDGKVVVMKGYGVKDTAVICRVERSNEELIVEFTNTTREEKVSTENLQVAFYRSDLVQRGAGLGLWLSNEIIRLHDGRIDISSGQHHFHVRMSLKV